MKTLISPHTIAPPQPTTSPHHVVSFNSCVLRACLTRRARTHAKCVRHARDAIERGLAALMGPGRVVEAAIGMTEGKRRFDAHTPHTRASSECPN